MTSTLATAAATARLSWQCNYTVADARWSLKQLHALHQLIIDNRDELVTRASKSHRDRDCEKEIARLVGDISQLISTASNPPAAGTKDLPLLGELQVHYRPVGVSLIICGEDNPIRWMLGSLAASIAAGNVTILATTISSNDPLLSVLSREWAQYLDRDCNFLVPSFDLSEFDQGMVNQVVIYDGFPQSYQSILASPGSKFFNTRDGGFNIAIICEGHKSWPLITQQVQSMTDPHIPILDRLHAIFIREEDVEPFQQSMNHVLESTRTDRNSGNEHVVVLKSLLSEHVDVDLDSDLASATEQGRLLLVVVRSLERAVDALVALSSSIMQLALLGPEASKVYSFVSTWVPAKVMAIDFIYPIAITRESTEPTSAVVSPHTFSRQMFKASRRTQQLPDDTPSIRATYEGLVVPLKPEPRGERIGFFTQVEYLVKSVGATLGLITIGGIYYGIRRFR